MDQTVQMDPESRAFEICVKAPDEGKRLDFLISTYLPDCSRSFVAGWIHDGLVTVCGKVKKAGYRVRTGDRIDGTIPEPLSTVYEPEPIPLDILHEDDAIIVINKQPGLVVHPAPGHTHGTLVNALLHHCPGIEAIGGEIRPGIVHRLDRDTSGVMIVAKNGLAMQHLARQFKSRQVKKQYQALVHGEVKENDGSISLPIGRHPVDRKRMSVTSRKSRHALTHWRVEMRYRQVTLLRLRILTGRTHQIRVHCAAMHHPVIGDRVYGGRKKNMSISTLPPEIGQLIAQAPRQMLHARRIGFVHPIRSEPLSFEAPLPADMTRLLEALSKTTLYPGPVQSPAHSQGILS